VKDQIRTSLIHNFWNIMAASSVSHASEQHNAYSDQFVEKNKTKIFTSGSSTVHLRVHERSIDTSRFDQGKWV
jgi:hypothetical protein